MLEIIDRGNARARQQQQLDFNCCHSSCYTSLQNAAAILYNPVRALSRQSCCLNNGSSQLYDPRYTAQVLVIFQMTDVNPKVSAKVSLLEPGSLRHHAMHFRPFEVQVRMWG